MARGARLKVQQDPQWRGEALLAPGTSLIQNPNVTGQRQIMTLYAGTSARAADRSACKRKPVVPARMRDAPIRAKRESTMYDRKFFRTKLGRAALLSIAAMLAMNVVALQQQGGGAPADAAVLEQA